MLKMDKKMVKDIILLVLLALITLWFYVFNHECQEFYTVQCRCPCAEYLRNITNIKWESDQVNNFSAVSNVCSVFENNLAVPK